MTATMTKTPPTNAIDDKHVLIAAYLQDGGCAACSGVGVGCPRRRRNTTHLSRSFSSSNIMSYRRVQDTTPRRQLVNNAIQYNTRMTSLYGLSANRKFIVRIPGRPTADKQFEVCTRWMTEVDLPSLQLQRDCAMSVTEGGGGMRFYAFCSCDFDLDPITLIYQVKLKIPKMHLHTKNELSRSRLSEVMEHYKQTERQTDRQTRLNVLPRRIRAW